MLISIMNCSGLPMRVTSPLKAWIASTSSCVGIICFSTRSLSSLSVFVSADMMFSRMSVYLSTLSAVTMHSGLKPQSHSWNARGSFQHAAYCVQCRRVPTVRACSCPLHATQLVEQNANVICTLAVQEGRCLEGLFLLGLNFLGCAALWRLSSGSANVGEAERSAFGESAKKQSGSAVGIQVTASASVEPRCDREKCNKICGFDVELVLVLHVGPTRAFRLACRKLRPVHLAHFARRRLVWARSS